MVFILHLFLSLALLVPSLVHAATLGIPGSGTTLSGVGVISGWKCQAGELTIRFDGGDPIPLLYGSERTDVRTNGQCLENDHDNVGFVAIWNWGNLEAGEHTAVAYDDGVEFARSTFTVVQASEEEPFLRDVVAECTVPDFPDAGTNARFEWSTGTQHLELAQVGEDVVVPVSTAFDGTWELSGRFAEDNTCDTSTPSLPSVSSIPGEYGIEDGFIFYGQGFTDPAGDAFTLSFYGIVGGSDGELKGTYYFGPRDDPFSSVAGSLTGFLEKDGTGWGRWMYSHYGCEGFFDFTKQ